ncbi:MAG: cysteine desulfurase [Gammaproteobacteria bacterium]|nr:cysteine desulfurase [Gammaproteobacteria bacterium]
MFNIENIRKDFPILSEVINGKPLIYLDNAATTQKPQAVIDTLKHYYEHTNANVHRSVYTLSERATKEYEAARDKVQKYIHATHREEVIWVRGTTEAINLVAQSFLRPQLKAGDEILITAMEHHANIVPWQLVAEQTGAVIKVLPINDQGELILDELDNLLTSRTKLFAFTYISNAIGTINPVKWLIDKAHEKGIPVLVDGAQALPHVKINVQQLNCEFFACSAHKGYGPTGIGVLYGKKELLEKMPPYQGGGDMIRTVSFEKTTFAELPLKFEAGTPNIADAIGFGAAIDYLSQLDWKALMHYEHELFLMAKEALKEIPGLRIIGEAKDQASIISFVMDGAHPHDIGTIVDSYGVAIRASHHCAMPLMKRFCVPATARVSFSFYNTKEEIQVLLEALHGVKKVFGLP